MDTRYEAHSGQYYLRLRKFPNYSYLHTTLAMMQYSMKKKLEVFGQAEKRVVTSEL
jgi:hypothetical protein